MAITKYTDVDGYGIPYNKDGNWGGGSGGGTTYTLTEGNVGTDPAVKLNGDDGSLTVAKFDGNDFKFDLGMIKAKGYSMRVTDSTGASNGMFELLKDGNPIATWGYDGSDFNVETDATGYTTISAVGGTSSARHLAVSTDPDGWNLYLSDDMGMQIGSCIKFPSSVFTFNESMPDYFEVSLNSNLKVTPTNATTDGLIQVVNGNGNPMGDTIYIDHNTLELDASNKLSAKGGAGGDFGMKVIENTDPMVVVMNNTTHAPSGNKLEFDGDDFDVWETAPESGVYHIETKGGGGSDNAVCNIYFNNTDPTTGLEGGINFETEDGTNKGAIIIDPNTMSLDGYNLSALMPPMFPAVDTEDDGGKTIGLSRIDVATSEPTYDYAGDILKFDKDSFDVTPVAGLSNKYLVKAKNGGSSQQTYSHHIEIIADNPTAPSGQYNSCMVILDIYGTYNDFDYTGASFDAILNDFNNLFHRVPSHGNMNTCVTVGSAIENRDATEWHSLLNISRVQNISGGLKLMGRGIATSNIGSAKSQLFTSINLKVNDFSRFSIQDTVFRDE